MLILNKNHLRAVAILLSTILSCLFLFMPIVLADIPQAPKDFLPGSNPEKRFLIAEGHYKDDSIEVKIEKTRYKDTECFVARISIKDASQLRTLSAAGFDENAVLPPSTMARRVKAVVASNGDYFSFSNKGHLIRQGKTYRELSDGRRDVLIIDSKGDFHAVYAARPDDIAKTLSGIKAANSFNFGPVLVDNGLVNKKLLAPGMGVRDGRQRMAIAQTGPLKYLIACCAGPSGGSKGLKLAEFASFVNGLDPSIRIAYNLDGGDSTSLVFMGEQINAGGKRFTREISDIIYFASARKEGK